ncbi:MAG: hypothetical protein IT285_09525 [Bdellovibrionales bacterium]|nr:hypothetical protein [Bdellovibrionales bacterium]
MTHVAFPLLALVLGMVPSLSFIRDSHANEKAPPKAIMHKRTPSFVDIEVPADDLWMGCSKPVGPGGSLSMMSFYALDGKTAYSFNHLRFIPLQECKEIEREYREMVKGAKTVRLVGHHPIQDKERKQYKGSPTPSRFTSTPVYFFMTFSRIQVGDRCKAYFPQDCDLPKN